MAKPFTVDQGMATLGPELLAVRDGLDRQLLRWAQECNATPMAFPALMKVSDLARFDYFDNFPQLALMVAGLRTEHAGEGPLDLPVPSAALNASEDALVSAACYNVYLHLAGATLAEPSYLTTVATCYRNEKRYEGLRRLRAFTMREIVCVGPRDAVQEHLADFKPKVLDLARNLGLDLRIEAATDPFFQPDSGRALLQKLFPVKEEFLHDGSLAIASVNFHRNFFGERCGIRLPDGAPAFTGCVAFGLERWIAALLDVHGEPHTILKVLSELSDE